MDRIERALELLISGHEQVRQDHKQFLVAQVVQSEQIGELLKVTQEHTSQLEKQAEQTAALDERVDKVVSSIGALIARISPSNPL